MEATSGGGAVTDSDASGSALSNLGRARAKRFATWAKEGAALQSQMAAIEAQLTRYLNGGTGLDPLVEEAIYNRGRARNDFEAKRVQDAALREAAAVATLDYVASKPDAPQAVKDCAAAAAASMALPARDRQ